MQKTLALALLALAPLTVAAAPKKAAKVAATTYTVDSAASKITWEGKKKIGDAHHGSLSVKSGKLSAANGKLTGGEFEIDMASLKVTDQMGEAMIQKLAGHLASDDFFSTAKHPTAKFVISKVDEKGAQAQISGDLTIKGQSKPLTFLADVTVGADALTAKAAIRVDRTKYGVRYNSGQYFPNLGDKIIEDEFLVNVDLQAKK